ncbi:unnamed protein product [Nippostrongylus brasiliensis]|uniref:CDP-alcohol phosphatidyltransferase n=1 Tax=Nippostrongylus brasiliensis TaxID=27835 RepID=A0A158R1J5_NIPBR|nr:unnamed protein product [Nippostrongylus brasiliensis]
MTREELFRLSEHRYSAVDTSWLSELGMKAYWEWAVEFYPLWLAPNLITLIGLAINLVSILILCHYCPTAREEAPSWAYSFSALSLFVYQTLDATDGKQARRTGAASPLGELFDHGCDSISQVFVTLNVAYAMRLGEVRCATFFIVIVSLRHLLLLTTLILYINQCFYYMAVILSGGVGRNGSTVAGTSVLFPLCPLLASIIPFCMIYSKSPSTVFDDNIALFVLCFGSVAAKATNRLIVGHMSRSELVLWDWIYLGPIALMLNQYYDFRICEKKLLVWVTVYTFLSLLVYCCVITRQICYHMKISCFSVPSKKQ